jgi:hypothetical protein
LCGPKVAKTNADKQGTIKEEESPSMTFDT